LGSPNVSVEADPSKWAFEQEVEEERGKKRSMRKRQ
jgi:hypothetical protein